MIKFAKLLCLASIILAVVFVFAQTFELAELARGAFLGGLGALAAAFILAALDMVLHD